MHPHGSAITRRAGHRDLELARQEREFRMQGRPLAQHLRGDARIGDFIPRDAGILVGSNVANAVAAGLQRVHLHLGEFGENIRRLFELGPVVLQVLARREMAIALVVAPRDMRQPAHLLR